MAGKLPNSIWKMRSLATYFPGIMQFLSFQAHLSLSLSLPLSLHQRRKTDGGGEIDWKWGLAVSCVLCASRSKEEEH